MSIKWHIRMSFIHLHYYVHFSPLILIFLSPLKPRPKIPRPRPRHVTRPGRTILRIHTWNSQPRVSNVRYMRLGLSRNWLHGVKCHALRGRVQVVRFGVVVRLAAIVIGC